MLDNSQFRPKESNFNRSLSIIGSAIFWICLAIIIVYTVNLVVFTITIKAGIDNLDKISSLTQNYKVSWIYMCPDYVQNYYSCPDNLKFINVTGKYCNQTIVCENKYIIENKS